jgi:hypothetical protein
MHRLDSRTESRWTFRRSGCAEVVERRPLTTSGPYLVSWYVERIDIAALAGQILVSDCLRSSIAFSAAKCDVDRRPSRVARTPVGRVGSRRAEVAI